MEIVDAGADTGDVISARNWLVARGTCMVEEGKTEVLSTSISVVVDKVDSCW